MSWGYRWKPYVPVAKRRADATRATAKMAKSGRAISPVTLSGRKIADTFWGKAWCENLEAYSDFANRLPRGRTYVRNGSVVDLQVTEGRVTALVSGSELYKIDIKIKALAKSTWAAVQKACTGRIDSLIEMLQGRLSSSVMQTVTQKNGGLFPKPAEIEMSCSCPDVAGLCKHLAASLYGVGARLDEKPELLFLLRGVDPAELISQASATEAIQPVTSDASGSNLSDSELADVFGIELESAPTPAPATPRSKPQRPGKKSPAVTVPQVKRKTPAAKSGSNSKPTAVRRPVKPSRKPQKK